MQLNEFNKHITDNYDKYVKYCNKYSIPEDYISEAYCNINKLIANNKFILKEGKKLNIENYLKKTISILFYEQYRKNKKRQVITFTDYLSNSDNSINKINVNKLETTLNDITYFYDYQNNIDYFYEISQHVENIYDILIINGYTLDDIEMLQLKYVDNLSFKEIVEKYDVINRQFLYKKFKSMKKIILDNILKNND